MKFVRPLLEALGLVLVIQFGYGFPGPSGRGFLEVAAALALPILLGATLVRGRALGWIYLALLLGFAGLFHWVPRTVSFRGNLPLALGWLSGLLIMAWEALGLLGVLACARWARSRGGPLAAGAAAALALLLWERFGFHIYPWSLGAALGGLPWLARGAAFLGAQGLAALVWGVGVGSAAHAAQPGRSWRVLLGPALVVGLLLAAGTGWKLLPREPEHCLDVVMIQPNYDPGLRDPNMEADMWRRTDAELRRQALPHPGTTTLVLWPESSVLGRDDRQPNPRLGWEAQRRNVAWLYGTEGGLYNLVRGEVAGQPAFVQAKIEPLAFGERMPGPAWLRQRLDHALGFLSQEPGTLTAASSFVVPSGQGPLRIHPLLCSEALSPERVRAGLGLAGGDLLANQSNDAWFETSVATDLHAAQIRLRAVEAGLPLLRATLSGKSGLFLADGSWSLWGAPMTEAAHSLHLVWRPVRTPARSPWLLPVLLAGLTLVLLGCLARPRV